MDNTTTPVNEEVPPVPPLPDATNEEVKEVKLVDVPIDTPNTALNVIVSFLNLAQKRGAFGIDEAAKIWDCVKMFQQQQ
jgi:hypothetical protein